MRVAGRDDGDPVMLLHGFPETSIMWEDLMIRLAEAGYRCAAPNQRGYSAGARPEAIQAYAGNELVADVFALADALGWERFHLVAHDWGAAVGWQALQHAPSRIVSFSALSIPHYRAFAESSWEDAETADYRGFLELVLGPEGAAERALSQSDMAGLRSTWVGDARTIEDYVETLSQPSALRSVLAWYRASQGHRSILQSLPDASETISVPTVVIWGRRDLYVHRGAVDRAARFMAGPYHVVELDAGHWLAQEAGPQVLAAVLSHLERHPA